MCNVYYSSVLLLYYCHRAKAQLQFNKYIHSVIPAAALVYLEARHRISPLLLQPLSGSLQAKFYLCSGKQTPTTWIMASGCRPILEAEITVSIPWIVLSYLEHIYTDTGLIHIIRWLKSPIVSRPYRPKMASWASPWSSFWKQWDIWIPIWLRASFYLKSFD
jgi:hypothetical protein